MTLGASLDLPQGTDPRGKPSLCFDFERVSGDGNKLEVWGVTYDVRIRIGNSTSGFVPYAGIGVGIFRANLNMTIPGGGGSSGGGEDFRRRGRGGSSGGGSSGGGGDTIINESDTRGGAKFMLGAWLNERFFVEASYRLSGRLGGVSTDSFSLILGVKF